MRSRLPHPVVHASPPGQSLPGPPVHVPVSPASITRCSLSLNSLPLWPPHCQSSHSQEPHCQSWGTGMGTLSTVWSPGVSRSALDESPWAGCRCVRVGSCLPGSQICRAHLNAGAQLPWGEASSGHTQWNVQARQRPGQGWPHSQDPDPGLPCPGLAWPGLRSSSTHFAALTLLFGFSNSSLSSLMCFPEKSRSHHRCRSSTYPRPPGPAGPRNTELCFLHLLPHIPEISVSSCQGEQSPHPGRPGATSRVLSLGMRGWAPQEACTGRTQQDACHVSRFSQMGSKGSCLGFCF